MVATPAAAAYAAQQASVPAGNDVSYPQCGKMFPSGQAFGVRRCGERCEWRRRTALFGRLPNGVAPRLCAREEKQDRREIVLKMPAVERRLEIVASVHGEEFDVAGHLRQRGRLVLVVSDGGRTGLVLNQVAFAA